MRCYGFNLLLQYINTIHIKVHVYDKDIHKIISKLIIIFLPYVVHSAVFSMMIVLVLKDMLNLSQVSSEFILLPLGDISHVVR
jgi:hypothetical protein